MFSHIADSKLFDRKRLELRKMHFSPYQSKVKYNIPVLFLSEG